MGAFGATSAQVPPDSPPLSPACSTACVPWHAALVAEHPPSLPQACREVNLYISLLLGVALPLVAATHLQVAGGRQQEAFAAHATGQAQQGGGSGERRQLDGLPPPARPGCASLPIQLYFASCIVWCGSSLASLVWSPSAMGGSPRA